MDIGITNWDKHNPRRDQKTYTWLKLSNDFGTDPDMFGYTPEEKYIWILLLCEASKRSSSQLSIRPDWLAHISGISLQRVAETLHKLMKDEFIFCPVNGVATVDDIMHDRTRSYSTACTTPILDKNRIDKNREEESRKESAGDSCSDNTNFKDQDFSIPKDIMAFLETGLMYPADIIESVRLEAVLKFLSDTSKDKEWHRFVGNYFKYEKHRIEETLRERAKNLPKPEIKHSDCKLCDNSGRAIMIEKVSSHEYAFRCICSRGKEQVALPEQFPGMDAIYTHFKSWAVGNYDRKSVVKNHRATVAI